MVDFETQTFSKSFITESGDELQNPHLVYHTWGKLNNQKNNVILICHALTGNSDASDWFSGLFETGGIIDLDKHFVICINHPGSCYGSIGPTSIDPNLGNPYQANFPELTIRDIVRLEQQLLDELGIQEIELIIGGSMGGMIALEFCVMDSRIKSACLIAMGASHSAWAIGISEAQRIAIKADRNWNDGFYTNDSPPAQGLAAARSMAMITYRSPQDYERKFGRNWNIQKKQFEVESYLGYQGEKLVQRFDANSYITLTKAMDSHDIARGRGTVKTVLERLTIPILIIGIDSDLLYPIHEQIELAEHLPNSTFREIKSKYGHDAFLIEFEQMNRALRQFREQPHSSLID
ncbi:MAG: homoserine O-acetyltransferase [Balneolaceae bacterium]|nr:homoserine O-acetyltransferase [Balneolaceae bacterium]